MPCHLYRIELGVYTLSMVSNYGYRAWQSGGSDVCQILLRQVTLDVLPFLTVLSRRSWYTQTTFKEWGTMLSHPLGGRRLWLTAGTAPPASPMLGDAEADGPWDGALPLLHRGWTACSLLNSWTQGLRPSSLENAKVQGSRSSFGVPSDFGPTGCLCTMLSCSSFPRGCWQSLHKVSSCDSGGHEVTTIFLFLGLGSMAELYLMTSENFTPFVQAAHPASISPLNWDLSSLDRRLLREFQRAWRHPLSAVWIPPPGVSQRRLCLLPDIHRTKFSDLFSRRERRWHGMCSRPQ